MAVNGYIGWSSHCNRIILDSTSITIGKNATRQSELEFGNKRSLLKSMFIPDEYSVTMEFEWDKTDEYGKSELQYFYEWYKYKHKYGTIPFEFPKILYSPNSGIKPQDDIFQYNSVEFYKITSAIEGSKSGSKVQIKMTWETVYGGVISIEEPEPTVNFIEATTSHLDIFYSSIGDLIPVLQDFKVYVQDEEVEKTGFYFDGTSIVRIYFTCPLSPTPTSKVVTFSYLYEDETTEINIPKDAFTTVIEA